MNKIEEIIKLTGKEIRFDTPVKIKGTPHSFPVNVYDVSIDTERGNVWLRTGDEKFYKLEETDQNFDIVANSILQRLRLLKKVLA